MLQFLKAPAHTQKKDTYPDLLKVGVINLRMSWCFYKLQHK